jgi:hypothetical protein
VYHPTKLLLVKEVEVKRRNLLTNMIEKKEIIEDKVDKNELISQIIKLELELTSAIFRGHKAIDNDDFTQHRVLLAEYRKKVFQNG